MPVPDKRWVHLCQAFKPRSKVQAVLEIWDIAGLVRGAHEGYYYIHIQFQTTQHILVKFIATI